MSCIFVYLFYFFFLFSNFKESVHGQYPLIQLLNPTKSRGRHSRGEPQFGPLLIFKDNLLVTYTSDALLILDSNTISVVAALFDVQKISALCVSKSEIFILEGERHLMRIGFSPENTSIKCKCILCTNCYLNSNLNAYQCKNIG